MFMYFKNKNRTILFYLRKVRNISAKCQTFLLQYIFLYIGLHFDDNILFFIVET